MAEFVASLERPRAVIVMVKAGQPTDDVIEELVPLLDEDDIVIDCGNAHFQDTRRREEYLREKGIHFVGCGVSGGEEGALLGPSIMPGGSKQSYEKLGPIFESIAAQVDGTPCCVHVGPDGAGHFVKMVHNGIEYADMQLIAEAYDLLRAGLGASPAEIAEIFRDWNEGDLESFLIEITADVLAQTDEATGNAFVDVVLDQAEQKGTGRWTVQSALDLGVPITGIAEATFARALSGHAEQREPARAAFGSETGNLDSGDRDGFIADVRRALYASKVVAYAQGFDQIIAGIQGVRLVGRPRRDGHDLARRLHHPGPVPQPHPRGLRGRSRPAVPAGRAVLRRCGQGRRRLVAPGRVRRGAGRHPDPGVLVLARLLRRASPRPPARRADPGAARQLRRAHLPARRPGRRVPRRVGRRQEGAPGSLILRAWQMCANSSRLTRPQERRR